VHWYATSAVTRACATRAAVLTHYSFHPGCWCFQRCCTLEPDSLSPLDKLASLWALYMHACTGTTTAALERLFSKSVQGCLLQADVGRAILCTNICCHQRLAPRCVSASRTAGQLLHT
jgi:hypothetical protein